MRMAKMLGLAALAAVAAMAFVGASSASATTTQLCNTDTNPCSSPTTHVHFVTLTGEPATILNSIANISCTVLFLGTVGALGLPQVITGNFTYTGCTSAVGGCSFTEVSKSATLNITKTGVETAKVTGVYEILETCAGFIHCIYNGTGLEAASSGSLGTGHSTIIKQIITRIGGFICPSSATLDILLGTLSPIYIRE